MYSGLLMSMGEMTVNGFLVLQATPKVRPVRLSASNEYSHTFPQTTSPPNCFNKRQSTPTSRHSINCQQEGKKCYFWGRVKVKRCSWRPSVKVSRASALSLPNRIIFLLTYSTSAERFSRYNMPLPPRRAPVFLESMNDIPEIREKYFRDKKWLRRRREGKVGN